ncbi:acyltransferase [Paenibacillus anseongense]|uniref:acyltransferase family protein n=1 Tax=Paenibacillus anseongense TaxID=2682845 RepID=UPI002DB9E9D7|nr:acyltransferase [Paenibacillus anseongense]MEC0264411.1 acyltransferase [Paenibacillus anseongense]
MLNSLTSFRFFAAFMVYLWHIKVLEKYQLGPVGVSFFFVLSGFILAFNYHSKFDKLQKNNIKKFYIARIAKIYPVHVLTFLMATPLVLLGFHPENLYFVKLFIISFINLMLLQSYVPGFTLDFNLVSWSLSDELFFYLLCPFILWALTKLKINTRRKALSLSFFTWLVLLLLTLLLTVNDAQMNWWLHSIFPLFRVFDFIIGILLGLTFVFIKQKDISKKSLFNTLEIASLVVLIVWIMISPNIAQTLRYSVYYLPVWCLLIYVFAFQGGFISKVLSNSKLVYLGEISFSFYMIHDLIIRYMDFVSIDSFSKALISLVLSVLLSSLVYRYYEEPMRKRIRFGAKNTLIPYKETLFKQV